VTLLGAEMDYDFSDAVVYNMSEPYIKSGDDVTKGITFELLDQDWRVIQTDNTHQATISSVDSDV
jgi:hypothetical protein